MAERNCFGSYQGWNASKPVLLPFIKGGVTLYLYSVKLNFLNNIYGYEKYGIGMGLNGAGDSSL
jgi:hypothetical protein